MAAAAAVALIVATQSGGAPDARPVGLNERDLESATLFVKALNDHEVDLALTYLSAEADLSGFGGEARLRAHTKWFESAGVRLFDESCLERGGAGPGTAVRCEFVLFALHSGGIDLSFEGGYFDLEVLDGEISRVSLSLDLPSVAADIWEPFAEWVAVNAVDDAPIMYEDWPAHDRPTFSEESFRLWDRHTHLYVASLRQARADFADEVNHICSAASERLAADLDEEGLDDESWNSAYLEASPGYLMGALEAIGELEPPDLFREHFDRSYRVIEQVARSGGPPFGGPWYELARQRYGFNSCPVVGAFSSSLFPGSETDGP